ncbi:MAG: RNA methyltransferase [Firmicutes bacterium]|nr:RNA methyltransferase [Bacillota bacterium]
MKLITSKDNDLIKHVRSLSDKKTRKEFFEFVVEGARWIYDALNINNVECVSILLKNSKKNEFLSHLEKVLDNLTKVVLVDDNIFEKLETTENGQGIIAVFKQNLKNGIPKGSKILFLDQVSDPGNLGTIIRTACGAGYNDIVLNNCTDPFSPKSSRASMSALLKVSLYDSGIDILDRLKETHQIIAASIDGTSMYELSITAKKLCLVIGNEAHGISPQIKLLCHEFISIPTQNIESLNAAVSAGILMYMLR